MGIYTLYWDGVFQILKGGLMGMLTLIAWELYDS